LTEAGSIRQVYLPCIHTPFLEHFFDFSIRGKVSRVGLPQALLDRRDLPFIQAQEIPNRLSRKDAAVASGGFG
jgi:hypothetical protein